MEAIRLDQGASNSWYLVITMQLRLDQARAEQCIETIRLDKGDRRSWNLMITRQPDFAT